MINVLSVVGARPQFIKEAAIHRVITGQFSHAVREIILHTGQHYDENMSGMFFAGLQLPAPDYNLNAGSGTHGRQTARMMTGIEKTALEIKPDLIMLYGDTNSTLAGALAASKLHIPIAHVEAGLRSHDKSMPEEINRVVCDHLSSFLFCPTHTAMNNLAGEGINTRTTHPFDINYPLAILSGDVMYDHVIHYARQAETTSSILNDNRLSSGEYILATVHRDHNTDQPHRLNAIFKALHDLSMEHGITVVIPLHPRTSKLLKKSLNTRLYHDMMVDPLIRIMPPLSFFDMLKLEKHAKIILTDSGGVQKEAYFFNKPVIILRSVTEWTEIIDNRAGVLTDTDGQLIRDAYRRLVTSSTASFPRVFGDGKAAESICQTIVDSL
jgi:UDP-GlcNAc3NAcA epimerase